MYGRLYPDQPITPFAAKLDASRVYQTMRRLSRRPLAIAEMGVVDDAARGKAAGIRAAYAAGRYPRIRAATWWNMAAAGTDTRIDSSPASLDAFRAGVAGTFFAGRLQLAGTCAR